MDPVAVVVTALAAGASAGGSRAASADVRVAYKRLRAAVIASIGDEQLGADVFKDIERHPERTDVVLLKILHGRRHLLETGILDFAERLIDLLDRSGRVGYAIGVRGVSGVQVGDHNTQLNTFDHNGWTK